MNNLSEQPSIYIASFNMRGIHAPLPLNTIKINVTSCQNSNNPYRIAFSPMTPIKNTYKGFYCFENYWQSGKVFENINHQKNILWWKNQIKGKKKNPSTKNNKILENEFDIVDFNDFNDKIEEIYFKNNLIPKININTKNCILNSDIIIFSCGTQFSSLIPTYKTEGFNNAIINSKAKKYLILN